MLIPAHQFFLRAIRLPSHRRYESCDLQRIGGVGELVGLDDDHVAVRSLLDGEGSVDHLLIDAQQVQRVLWGGGAAGGGIGDDRVACFVLSAEVDADDLLAERADWDGGLPQVALLFDPRSLNRLQDRSNELLGIGRRGRKGIEIQTARGWRRLVATS